MSLSRSIDGIVMGLAALTVVGCASSAIGADAAPAGDGAVTADAFSADAPVGADAGGDAAMIPPATDAASAGACARDDDCQLINDCCSCEAIPRGENAPACDSKRVCLTSECTQYPGVDQARCSAGRCVLGFDCDPTMIACKRLPPVCPAGQTPQIIGQGGARCYGECVDARQCLTVPACAACRPTDLCARSDMSTALHCLGPTTTAFGER
jgi:hypothetical protein